MVLNHSDGPGGYATPTTSRSSPGPTRSRVLGTAVGGDDRDILQRSLEPDAGSVVCGSASGLLLGGEELASLFEEHAQLVVAVRAEKVVEVLLEGLLASGALAVGFLASGGDVEGNAAAGAQPSLEIFELLQSCDDLADRLLGLRRAARDLGHGDPWPG